MTTGAGPTPAERARRFGETAIKTPANVVTFAGWLVLAVTDGLDGWLARRDGTTRSGAFLDPLADKILVTGAFVALAVRGDIAWLPVIIVIAREGGVSVWRTLAGRRGVSVPARRLGKWKANVQFLAVAIVLFPPTEDAPHLYNPFLWLAVAFSVVSALDLVLASRRPQPQSGSATAAPAGAEPLPEAARPSPSERHP